MDGEQFLAQPVQGFLDAEHLRAARDGLAVGVVPELLLVDAGQALESRFGEDAGVDREEAPDIHPEIDHIVPLQLRRNLVTVFYAAFYQEIKGIQQAGLDLGQGMPGRCDAGDFFNVGSIIRLGGFDDSM